MLPQRYLRTWFVSFLVVKLLLSAVWPVNGFSTSATRNFHVEYQGSSIQKRHVVLVRSDSLSLCSSSRRAGNGVPKASFGEMRMAQNIIDATEEEDNMLEEEKEEDVSVEYEPSFLVPFLRSNSWSANYKEVQNAEMQKKIVNFFILAASFGYAAYTILNIDHGMTRGWTQSEIAMRIPADNWNMYETSLAESPVFTKTLINVVIYLLGDWLSQTVFQKKNALDFDATRTLRNGFIGLCFGPLVHEYYQFSDHILPVENGLTTRLEKILMDQTLYLTIKCSIYIAAVELLQGKSIDMAQESVKDRIGGIVVTAWKFWPLIHCITYSVIPARHRILWVNCVDLVWNGILASLTNKEDGEEELELKPATAGEKKLPFLAQAKIKK